MAASPCRAAQDLGSDPLAALEFMYSKMFMRRRRDSISVVFRDRTLEVLHTYTRLEDIDLGGLDRRLRERRVNNRYDRRMVLESINFASRDLHAYNCNVFNWAAAAIREGSARRGLPHIDRHLRDRRQARHFLPARRGATSAPSECTATLDVVARRTPGGS